MQRWKHVTWSEKRERLEALLGSIRGKRCLVQAVLCLHNRAMSGPSPGVRAHCPGRATFVA